MREFLGAQGLFKVHRAPRGAQSTRLMRLGEEENGHCPLLIGTTPVPGNKPPPAALTRHSHDRSGDHPGHHRGGGSNASPQPAGPQWPQPCPTPPRPPHWLGGCAPAHWGDVGGACVETSAGREGDQGGQVWERCQSCFPTQDLSKRQWRLSLTPHTDTGFAENPEERGTERSR